MNGQMAKTAPFIIAKHINECNWSRDTTYLAQSFILTSLRSKIIIQKWVKKVTRVEKKFNHHFRFSLPRFISCQTYSTSKLIEENDHPCLVFYLCGQCALSLYQDTKVLVNKIENGYDKHKVHA